MGHGVTEHAREHGGVDVLDDARDQPLVELDHVDDAIQVVAIGLTVATLDDGVSFRLDGHPFLAKRKTAGVALSTAGIIGT